MGASAWISCLALAISGGAAAPPPKAQFDDILRVNRVQVDRAAREGSAGTDIELQNLSGKTITAYQGFCSARYADGSEKRTGEWTTDLLYGDAVPRSSGTPGPQLGPGKTYVQRVSVALGPNGTPPVSVTAGVTMIVFEDGTALGDPWAVQLIAYSRRAYSKARAELIAELRGARAAATSDQDLADRLDKLKAAASGENVQALKLFSQVLPAGRQVFDRMLDIWEAQGRAVAQDKLVAASETSAAPGAALALRSEREEGRLVLSWNRDAPAVRNAQRAKLTIVDGDHTEDVALDPVRLRGGSITYKPVTSDVTFRLEVEDSKSGKSVSETLRVLAGAAENPR